MTTPTDPGAPASGETAARIAVVAGSGRLPANVVAALLAEGRRPVVLLIEGESDDPSEFDGVEHQTVVLEDFGSLISRLKRLGASEVVFAGGVSRRPRWRDVRPSLGLVAMLGSAIRGFRRGDNGLLSRLVAHVEASGIRVLGAHEVAADLVAGHGALTRRKPNRQERVALAAAFRAAKAIGALDVGQAAIAFGQRVVALEDVAGTDELLLRTASLRGNGRIAGAAAGVLVKCSKPGQERRVDLPTIGPKTIDGAHRAGLAGVAVEAGHALILDHAAVIERADALGIFVAGISEEDFA